MHDLHAFADPWEHVRLLSDEARNAALLALLQRRAPGRRVLEVGCGTGLLSVVAARLGATEVHAVEPTERADVAAALVAANGLDGVVHVHRAAIEDLDPRPVDLAFSELLNVDPFVEGLLEASRAASAWLVPSGHLAPSRLRLYGALVGDDDSAAEVARVRTLLDRLARDHDLRLDPLQEELAGLEPYPASVPRVSPTSRAMCLLDVALGTDEDPEVDEVLTFETDRTARGLAVWFEAVLDDGLTLGNPPGDPGHWGHLVLGWPDAVEPVDGRVCVAVGVDDEGVTAEPA